MSATVIFDFNEIVGWLMSALPVSAEPGPAKKRCVGPTP